MVQRLFLIDCLSCEQTIKNLLQLGQDADPYFTVKSLGIHTVSFLTVFILAYGVATPGGIFMPSMMVNKDSEACDHVPNLQTT